MAWAEPMMDENFGGRLQARRGELLDVLDPPGFLADSDREPRGFLTYRIERDECELAFLMAMERRKGIGTALLDALRAEASTCSRIWVVTTNDNLDALRFYQRRGFVLHTLRPGAIDEARRRLKPRITLVGDHGIPMRDELELELILA